jgi:dipeptidyl aminopeptidase/acylaminoacyl peptidase
MTALRFRRLICALCVLALALQSNQFCVAQQKRLLQIDDLFTVKQIIDLQMSPSGNSAMYVQQEIDLKGNCYRRTIWQISTSGAKHPSRLTDSDKDYSPRWSEDGGKVVFLSTRSDLPQVWMLDLTTHKLEQLTNSSTGVLSFSLSPNGRVLAYSSRAQDSKSFDNNIRNENKGVVIDRNTFSVYQLVRSKIFLDREKDVQLFLLELGSREVKRIDEIRYVQDFDWSPDSRSLALTTKRQPGYKWSSDISLYDLETGRFSIMIPGEQGESLDVMAGYSSPLWSPDGNRIVVTYRPGKERWSSVSRLGIYDFSKRKLTLITNDGEVEPASAKLSWGDDNTIYFENTVKRIRGLYTLSPLNGQVKPAINSNACDELFSFSKDKQQVVYLHQSLQSPPEIYFSKIPFSEQKKLTSLNSGFDKIKLPDTERMSWKAPDGVQVEGVLFKPIDYNSNRKYPLLVLLHGGPNLSFEDRFEPYSFNSEWLAPYPLRIFANRGFAVLIPDYRGTPSYGKKFMMTRDLMKVPSEDIMSGIDTLINNGLADPNKIGVIGQSHGFWLGAALMAHHRIFKAASLAEGAGNLMTVYAQMPGWSNLNIRDYYWGTPYDDPQRYIEQSPVFSFKGLDTATLLEFGDESAAIQGLDTLTALWRQGVPNEMVVYPKTGHNISSPTLLLESANRNLDWFDYWMLGKKDQDPSKQEQYRRWETMKVEMEKMRRRSSSTQ